MDLVRHPYCFIEGKVHVHNKLHCAISMLYLTVLVAQFFPSWLRMTYWKTHISSLYYLNGLINLLIDDRNISYCSYQVIYI